MSTALNPEWEKFTDKQEQSRQERIAELRKAIEVGLEDSRKGRWCSCGGSI